MYASRPGIIWSTAQRADVMDFGDCFRVNLYWDNGDHCYVIEDTKDDAIAALTRYGFTPK
jgi:hypothetical protein